jgi:hypothetical protein
VEPELDVPELLSAGGDLSTALEPTFTLSEVDLKALVVTAFEEGYKTGRAMRFKKEQLEDVMHTFAARLIQVRPWEVKIVGVGGEELEKLLPEGANESTEPEAPTAPKRVRPDTPETKL